MNRTNRWENRQSFVELKIIIFVQWINPEDFYVTKICTNDIHVKLYFHVFYIITSTHVWNFSYNRKEEIKYFFTKK